MKRFKKISLWLLGVFAGLYIILCVGMYFFQEKLLFHPPKLDPAFKFTYENSFEELYIAAGDEKKLNGLLFKADSAKGLIFYLHGNGGALNTWGNAAKNYVKLGYDVFILDYRGFGKSEGEIYSEEQFYSDVQTAYNELKKKYNEKDIAIIGYSIGTSSAAMLASCNNPKILILQAPYYSMIDMMHHTYPFVPDFVLKYKFETFKFVEKCKMPVYIFHGDADETIYYGSSVRLKEHFKPSDKLFTLQGKGHRKMNEDETYLQELARVLK